jgi:hypothetical protein
MLWQRRFSAGRLLAKRMFHNLSARDLKQLEDLLLPATERKTNSGINVGDRAARIIRIEQHLDVANRGTTLEALAAAELPKGQPIIKEESPAHFQGRLCFGFFDMLVPCKDEPWEPQYDLCALIGSYFEYNHNVEIHGGYDEYCRKLEIHGEHCEGWLEEDGYKRLSPRNPLWEGGEDSEYDCDYGLDLEDLNVLPPEDGPMYLFDGVWLHSGGHLSHCPHDPHK